MKKALVETNGDYQLYDMFGGGATAYANRPTVVALTPFFQNLVGTRLTIVEQLADDASDADLAAAKTEDELLLAIEVLPRPTKAAPAPKAEKVEAPAKPKGK